LKLAGVIVSKESLCRAPVGIHYRSPTAAPMGRDARSLNSDPLGAPEPSMTRQHAVKIFTFALMIPFVACGRGRESAGHQSDSAFAAMQVRGQTVMGVDQYASAHVFEDLEDGGRIVLDAENLSDTAGIVAIRHHMRDIATAFRAGDFARPFQVHGQVVPGTAGMAARRTTITYEATDRPRGAEVRIRTTDSLAVAAIHAFLAFQRTAHHAAGHEAMPGGVH